MDAIKLAAHVVIDDKIYWEGTLRAFKDAPLEELIPGKPLTQDEIALYLREVGVPWDFSRSLEYLEMELTEKQLLVAADNTYNWNWWGPVINWCVFEPDVLFIKKHIGYDVRVGYTEPLVYRGLLPEDMPWHTADLQLHLIHPETNQLLGVAHCIDPEGIVFELPSGLAFRVDEVFDVDVTEIVEDLIVQVDPDHLKKLLEEL